MTFDELIRHCSDRHARGQKLGVVIVKRQRPRGVRSSAGRRPRFAGRNAVELGAGAAVLLAGRAQPSDLAPAWLERRADDPRRDRLWRAARRGADGAAAREIASWAR